MWFPTNSATTWDTFLSCILAVQILFQQIIVFTCSVMNPKWSDSQVHLQSQTLFSCIDFYLCLYLKNVVLNVYLNVSLITHEF